MASSYTNSWGKAFLAAIGAPFNAQTDLFLRAWSQSEGCTAAFNPLATTLEVEGFTDSKYFFNTFTAGNGSVMHVWKYPTWQVGVDATARTIQNGRYPGLLGAIRQGKSAMEMAYALKASPWGTGALTIKVLEGTPPEFPFGDCYPTPPAAFSHFDGGIRRGSSGADVDELLRCIARMRGKAGYKFYSLSVVAWVAMYQLKRPSLWKPDGIAGQLTYRSITGHN